MIDLRKTWLLEGAILASLGTALVAWMAWLGLRHGMAIQARAQASTLIDQFQFDASQAFRRGEAVAGALCQRYETGALNASDSPKGVLELLPFLDKEGLVTSLMVYESKGNVLFVNRTPTGWNVQRFRWDRGQPEGYKEQAGAWVPILNDPFSRHYNPRQRPWYAFAEAASGPGWMPNAYRFPSGPPGFSYVIPIRDAEGHLAAVVGADMDLSHYCHQLWGKGRVPFRNMIGTDLDHRILLPLWGQEMQKNDALLNKTLLQPLGALPRPLLVQRIAHSRGLPTAVLFMLEPEGGFPIPLWTVGVFVILPVLLTGGLLGGFVWRHHRRVVVPMANLAEAGANAGVVVQLSQDARQVRQFNEISESLSRGRASEEGRLQLQSCLETIQRSGTVGSMAAGIVHDANNQLTVIMSQLAMCSESLTAPVEAERYLERARGATMMCADVLKALLAYSRPVLTARELLELNQVLLDASFLLGRVLGSEIDLTVELTEGDTGVMGERVKLDQVIINLALNARDAMPQGGALSLRTRTDMDHLFLEVKDTGGGMTEEVRLRLFEPFFTTKAPGKGTGLGLAMVASIIKGMGGEIDVESTVGVGSCFRLSFPLRVMEAVESDAQGVCS